MNILGINFTLGTSKKTEAQANAPQNISQQSPEAMRLIGYHNEYFDGEKNFGELGAPINYNLAYKTLQVRGWQAYLENDLAKTIIDRYTKWIIGKGLKLQMTPLKILLNKQGNDYNFEEVSSLVEQRFKAWAETRASSFSGMENLNILSKQCFKQAKTGGDCLVVLRYKNKNVNVQLIDGVDVGSNSLCEPKNGNKIKHGVEINAKGTHVAYWVKSGHEYKRIKAINPSTGLRVAFMVYGDKYRVGNVRGLPIVGASLETMAKIDRYKEAAVGSAEERQKIAYFIEHLLGSDGDTPLKGVVAKALNYDSDVSGKELPKDDAGKQLVDEVAATTNKQTFNLTPGSSIKAIDSKQEMFFEEFYGSNANLVCAAVGIPPNVAFSLYTDSFSASRAATKDWEHSMGDERYNFQFQYYQPIFDFWLHMQVLENKIELPGYLGAFMNKDYILLQAYRHSRFTGEKFPHIDPVKEVQAERLKLGDKAKNIPLTSIDQATENLNGGDYQTNIDTYKQELDKAQQNGIINVDEPSENNDD